MKTVSMLTALLFCCSVAVEAQVGINSDNSLPDPSAGLDVNFTNKGFLPPRLTLLQRNAIANPVDGLVVFCTNCDADGTGVLSMFKQGKWVNLSWSCAVPGPPAAGVHSATMSQIIWHWNTVPIALGSKWNTVDDYSTATDLGTATSTIETGLQCNTNYTRYVWAYNDCGPSTRTVLLNSTTGYPVTPPTAGAQIPALTQIIWNWNAVPGASGYKWSTHNNYSSASDLGTVTSKTETGLICNTVYNRYVWAYVVCGNSTPVQLTQSTSWCPNYAGVENFNNYVGTSGTFSDGTFLGQDGSTWSYSQCRSDRAIVVPSPCLAKGRNPTGKVVSGSISTGCGTLNFDYKQGFSTAVNLNVFVNDLLVANVTSPGGSTDTANVHNSGQIFVNIPGSFVLKFKQADSLTSGQVTIDNVSWTSYSK